MNKKLSTDDQTSASLWVNEYETIRNKDLVDKTSATELSGEAMAENLVETPLVMVATVPKRVVHGSDVDHRVARIAAMGLKR